MALIHYYNYTCSICRKKTFSVSRVRKCQNCQAPICSHCGKGHICKLCMKFMNPTAKMIYISITILLKIFTVLLYSAFWLFIIIMFSTMVFNFAYELFWNVIDFVTDFGMFVSVTLGMLPLLWYIFFEPLILDLLANIAKEAIDNKAFNELKEKCRTELAESFNKWVNELGQELKNKKNEEFGDLEAKKNNKPENSEN